MLGSYCTNSSCDVKRAYKIFGIPIIKKIKRNEKKSN